MKYEDSKWSITFRVVSIFNRWHFVIGRARSMPSEPKPQAAGGE